MRYLDIASLRALAPSPVFVFIFVFFFSDGKYLRFECTYT